MTLAKFVLEEHLRGAGINNVDVEIHQGDEDVESDSRCGIDCSEMILTIRGTSESLRIVIRRSEGDGDLHFENASGEFIKGSRVLVH